MTLIHKGQFRERANRNTRYQQSENHQAHLTQHHYTPSTSTDKTETGAKATSNHLNKK